MTISDQITSKEPSKELKESSDLKQNQELIDDAFYVKQQKWGTWDSYDKENKPLITSLTEDECIKATRFYLKGRQEGFSESKSYEGKVGGKL